MTLEPPNSVDSVHARRMSLTAAWRGAVVQAATLALAFGLLFVVWLLVHPLALLWMAIVIATALAPAVSLFERRLPRLLSILLVYLILLLVAGGIGWAVSLLLAGQAAKLVANAPSLLDQTQQWLGRSQLRTFGDEQLLNSLLPGVDQFADVLISLPVRIVSTAAELVLVLVISLYWLIAVPRLRLFVLSLFPVSLHHEVDVLLQETGQTMGGYIRGSVMNGVAVGGCVYVGLLILGVDYPLVLALVAGLGELVPIAGPIIAAVPALAIALAQSPLKALIVLAFYVVLQQLENHILVPNIMSRQAHMSPLLVIVAFVAGVALGGILGALVAISLAGALQVVVVRVLAPAIRRMTGAAAL
jgi:predicted PurR-regulated permease PerM